MLSYTLYLHFIIYNNFMFFYVAKCSKFMKHLIVLKPQFPTEILVILKHEHLGPPGERDSVNAGSHLSEHWIPTGHSCFIIPLLIPLLFPKFEGLCFFVAWTFFPVIESVV